MKQVIPYYVRGHTAEGLVNYIDSNLSGVKNVVLLAHPVDQVISDVLSVIKNKRGKDTSYEIMYSPYLAKGLEGIIFREQSCAYLSANIIDDKANNSYKRIDVTKWVETDENKQENNETALWQTKAYEKFKKGLKIHDQLEKVYIDEMDFTKADAVTDELLQRIFHEIPNHEETAHIYERLFGTNTIDGMLNKVEELIAPITNRVYIKGRAGTGKSVLLKKVIDQSVEYGYDVELYRCSFDPNSVDMVIIRDLDYCLFDSTAPHEFSPTRSSDQLIDLYEDTVTAGTDEKHKAVIQQLTDSYKTEMKRGLADLHQLKDLQVFQHVAKQSEGEYMANLHQLADEIVK